MEAVVEAIVEEMRLDERVFIMGEDLESGLYGNFEISEFGRERVRNTPISEAGFLGAGVGAALTGLRPIVSIGTSTFMHGAMDQVINQAAKNRYMFGAQQSMPLVVRLSLGYGGSSAAHHSDRLYPMLMSIPGLKVVIPTNAADAKGLFKAAIREDDPVFIFEDGTLRGTKGPVPEEMEPIPLGVAAVAREGRDATVVAVAGSIRHALDAAAKLADEGTEVEVVDPRSLVPLDRSTIIASVRKTGRLVVAEPAARTCGAAAEVAAVVAEEAFDALRCRIIRVTAPDIPIPFSPLLERGLYPDSRRIQAAVRATLDDTSQGR
jgi:pyruvate dehydrogenase E1 component beta subunit